MIGEIKMIELKGRKVWGTGYKRDGEQCSDIDWKDKIKELVADQEYVIVKGRYGENNLDFHFNIEGFPFSLVAKDDFLKILSGINVIYGEDVYLYDGFKNKEAIWSKKTEITETNRYIFISHTATECQMF